MVLVDNTAGARRGTERLLAHWHTRIGYVGGDDRSGPGARRLAGFRAALKAAEFKSVRGDFKFGGNNFPVQDLHVFEAYKDDKGRMNLKTIATPLKASVDAYADKCKMN